MEVERADRKKIKQLKEEGTTTKVNMTRYLKTGQADA